MGSWTVGWLVVGRMFGVLIVGWFVSWFSRRRWFGCRIRLLCSSKAFWNLMIRLMLFGTGHLSWGRLDCYKDHEADQKDGEEGNDHCSFF